MRYVIVGAGGFGREICSAIRYNQRPEYHSDNRDDPIVFIDDNPNSLDKFTNYPPIVDSIRNFTPKTDDRLFIAMGNPELRKKFSTLLRTREGKFITIVHQESTFFAKCIIGKGTYVGWNAGVSCDVNVGNFVSLNCNLTVGHDAIIEDFVEVAPGTAIGGFCHIEEGVYIGPNCTISSGVRIGAWSKISASTAVMRDVPPCSYVIGVPGVVHRNFFQPPE